MIFVDSNVPMYVAGRDHANKAPAIRLLRRIREGELEACTSAEVLQEILHRYHGMGRADLARDVYELFVQVCTNVLPVTLADTDRALELKAQGLGVSVRDAVHAAVMLNHEIRLIATFDRGFDAVPGIERVGLIR